MFLKYNKWSLLWATIILILCGIPGRDIPHISFLELLSFDKFVHASIFFVLVLLTIRGFKMQTRFHLLHQFPDFTAVVICVVYGGLLEVMQGTLFVERSADIYDFIANSFGCLMAWLLYGKLEKNVLAKLIP